MSDEISVRDRIWAAIIEQKKGTGFTVETIREEIEPDNRPSDETIRRVLRSGTELGVIEHRSNSPYYLLALGESLHGLVHCENCGDRTVGSRYSLTRYSSRINTNRGRRTEEHVMCWRCVRDSDLQI